MLKNINIFMTYIIVAPVILRMMKHVLGNEMFWKIIEKFLNKKSK